MVLIDFADAAMNEHEQHQSAIAAEYQCARAALFACEPRLSLELDDPAIWHTFDDFAPGTDAPELSRLFVRLGDIEKSRRDPGLALQYYIRAVQAAESADGRTRAIAHQRLGELQLDHRVHGGEEHLNAAQRFARSELRAHPHDAELLMAYSSVMLARSSFAGWLAGSTRARALALARKAVLHGSGDPRTLQQLARVLEHCSRVAAHKGNHLTALTCLRESAQLWKQLVAAEQSSLWMYLHALERLVECEYEFGEPEQARQHADTCLDVWRSRLKDAPDSFDYRRTLADLLARFYRSEREHGDRARARALVHEWIEVDVHGLSSLRALLAAFDLEGDQAPPELHRRFIADSIVHLRGNPGSGWLRWTLLHTHLAMLGSCRRRGDRALALSHLERVEAALAESHDDVVREFAEQVSQARTELGPRD